MKTFAKRKVTRRIGSHLYVREADGCALLEDTRRRSGQCNFQSVN